MHYRKLHGTDIEISELGMGTWTLTTGWWGSTPTLSWSPFKSYTCAISTSSLTWRVKL